LKGGGIDHSCYLIGVGDTHAAVFERLQPFTGMHWTTELNSLSNPDKHRHLTIQRHQARVQLAGWMLANSATEIQVIRTSPTSFSFNWPMLDMAPSRMHMKMNMSTDVTIEGSVNVVKVLDDLKSEVAGVLEDFRPCFEGKCHH
jgi:hypothetical protein